MNHKKARVCLRGVSFQFGCAAEAPLFSNLASRLSVDGCDRNVVAGDTPCTWKVDGSIFLTLVKNCVGLPLVYFHCNDCIYHQNPVSGIGLSPSFPSKSAVLAQYYLDDDERSGDCLAQNYKKVSSFAKWSSVREVATFTQTFLLSDRSFVSWT